MTIPCPKQRRSGRAGLIWVALGLFALLAAGLMWPVPAHISSRVPGTATWAFDEYTFLWNNWYLRHALLDLHATPLHSDLIWYPLGIDLVLYTFNFTNAALALPLQLAFNLPFASNWSLLLATALSGLGAYLVALYALRTFWARAWSFFSPANLAALLAGVIYTAGSNRAVYAALGHYNFATSEWLPFYALYFLKTLRQPRPRNAVMAGLFFSLAALTEMTFATFLGLLSLVILLVSWRDLRDRRAALGRLALAAGVALLLWAPLLVPIAREFVSGGYGSTGWGESVTLSADALGFVTPTNLNPLISPPPAVPAQAAPQSSPSTAQNWQAELRAVEEGKGRFRDINTVFLGYLTLVLAVLGAASPVTRRQARVWTWSAVVFGVLTLGPLLQIAGRYRFSLDNLLPEGVTLPLPFALLHYVPFFNANRAPNRYSLILMLALAILAAFGAWRLLDRLERMMGADQGHQTGKGAACCAVPVLGLALAVVLIAEHLAVPLPTTDARVPDIYSRLAAEPGQFSVLQLPLGWRDSYGVLGSEDTRLQYYQTVSRKPIIGGNISRAPEFKMDYFRRIPLFRALTDLELYKTVPPDVDVAARAQAGALAALYDIRYLITYPPIPGRYPYQDTWQRVQEYALSVLPLDPTPVWEQYGARAYAVHQPAIPSPFRLDLGVPGNEPYLGEGWDAALLDRPYGATATWIDGRTADLYLPLAESGDRVLRIAVAPLSYPQATQQTLAVYFNDVPVLKGQPLNDGWQTVQARVPATATRRGPNRVRLELAWAASPRQVFPDAASRGVVGSTGVTSPVNIEARGSAEASISVSDRQGQETQGATNRRGYNVAVIDSATGQMLDTQGFDTAANRYEAERLTNYLAAIRPGQIVALATRGDAGAHLTDAAIASLRAVGSKVQTPGDLAGQAHALVGVKGSPPGSGSEAIAPGDAQVRVAGDFRTLSAAVDWVELGP